MTRCPPDVRAEPELAVFGGIDIYERLFEQAFAWLRPGGLVAVEIEESTAEAVSKAAEREGFEDLSVRQDLAGTGPCRERAAAAALDDVAPDDAAAMTPLTWSAA